MENISDFRLDFWDLGFVQVGFVGGFLESFLEDLGGRSKCVLIQFWLFVGGFLKYFYGFFFGWSFFGRIFFRTVL